MQNQNAIILTLNIGQLKIKTLNRDVKLSMFLNIAKKSTQVTKQIVSSSQNPDRYLINEVLTIKYDQLNLAKHKFCVLFIYEMRNYEQKRCIGYTSLNIFDSNSKNREEIKILQCEDANATLQLQLSLQYLHNNTPLNIYQKKNDPNNNIYEIQPQIKHEDNHNLSQNTSIFHMTKESQDKSPNKNAISRCRTTSLHTGKKNIETQRRNHYVHANQPFQTNSQKNHHSKIIETIKQSNVELRQCIKSLSLKLDKQGRKQFQNHQVLSIFIKPFQSQAQKKNIKHLKSQSLFRMINRQQRIQHYIMEMLDSSTQQIKIDQKQTQMHHSKMVEAIVNRINQYKRTVSHFKVQLKKKEEQIRYLNDSIDKKNKQILIFQEINCKSAKKMPFFQHQTMSKIMENKLVSESNHKQGLKVHEKSKHLHSHGQQKIIVPSKVKDKQKLRTKTNYDSPQRLNDILDKDQDKKKPINKKEESKIYTMEDIQDQFPLQRFPFNHYPNQRRSSEFSSPRTYSIADTQKSNSLSSKTRIAGLIPFIVKPQIKSNGYFIDFLEETDAKTNRSQKFKRSNGNKSIKTSQAQNCGQFIMNTSRTEQGNMKKQRFMKEKMDQKNGSIKGLKKKNS